MSTQSHGVSLHQEPAYGGATPPLAPVYLVSDGAGGVTASLTGPARYQLIDVEQDGNYLGIDLTPVYLVSDGAGGLTINQIGPATAILIDDGAGGMVSTADLTQTPIADLYYDTGGDLWGVRRVCDRLDAVSVRGDTIFY